MPGISSGDERSGSAEADATGGVRGHVFISYARVDAARADDVRRALETAGIRVWWDAASLRPGDSWRMRIRDAITAEALAFVACFSQQSVTREVSYQYEELNLAVEQLRRHRPDRPWLIPVRFDDCQISFTRDNPQYQAKVFMRQSPEWAAAVLMAGHVYPKHAANILDEMEVNFAEAVLEKIPPVRRREITVHMKRPG